MFPRKRFLGLSGLFLTLMLVLSACGGDSTNSLTPADVLTKAAQSMKDAKSYHLELQASSNIQVQNNTGSVVIITPTNGASPIGVQPGQIHVQGSGDVVNPNQQQVKLNIDQGNSMAAISIDNKVYVQTMQGQWYVLNKSAFQNATNNPFSYTTVDYGVVLSFMQLASLKDLGSTSVNGVSSRHLSATLDKSSLQALLTTFPQLKTNLGLSSQDLTTVINNLKTFDSTVDVFIDEKNFYLTRFHLQMDLSGQSSGTEGTAPSDISSKMDSTVDLTKFNEPVTINPPANATPTDNPGLIFGDGHP